MGEPELSSTVVLQTIDKLPYHQRVKYASKLGNDHKNSPSVQKLIKELREVLIFHLHCIFLYICNSF